MNAEKGEGEEEGTEERGKVWRGRGEKRRKRRRAEDWRKLGKGLREGRSGRQRGALEEQSLVGGPHAELGPLLDLRSCFLSPPFLLSALSKDNKAEEFHNEEYPELCGPRGGAPGPVGSLGRSLTT